jgi:hypothetical protein
LIHVDPWLEIRSSHDQSFTRQPVNFADAVAPIEHARLMMMLGLAEALKVGVLLLLVRSVSINHPIRISCAV